MDELFETGERKIFWTDEQMEAEGLIPEEVWSGEEITPVEKILETEISTQVPGIETAIVSGDPYGLGKLLDFQQGFDNPYGMFGTCGLTSVSNLCVMNGQEVTEPDVVTYAMENGLCAPPGGDSPFGGGGTTIGNLIDILGHYRIEAHCEFNDTADCERLAEVIEGGHGVILGLNSGVLQDREWKIYNDQGEVTATHAVCLTATVRDPDTGELTGFYMCDSSSQRPDGAQIYVTMDEMNECYTELKDGFAVITDKPIRS